jgi:hypothetical protein
LDESENRHRANETFSFLLRASSPFLAKQITIYVVSGEVNDVGEICIQNGESVIDELEDERVIISRAFCGFMPCSLELKSRWLLSYEEVDKFLASCRSFYRNSGFFCRQSKKQLQKRTIFVGSESSWIDRWPKNSSKTSD